MAEVLLFHHAHGLTKGILDLAEQLRTAGHVVHTPDLYEGRVFDTLDEGLAYARETGFGAVGQRGVRAAEGLPAELVYAGFSLGAMPAQELAQTRAGARGALLMHGAFSPTEFGDGWPASVPVQVHSMDADPFFEDEDRAAARELVDAAADGELFLYAGDQHLFVDASLPSYDEAAAALFTKRALEFLDRV